MNKTCGIYMIKNKINNKVYIGRSINIIGRLNRHKKELNKNIHINDHLQRAWDKYKEHNFEFKILEPCERNIYGEREEYWIAYYKSNDPKYGYNGTAGGDGGEIPNKETRKKISNSLKNGNHQYRGKHLSEEHKQKISKGIQGKVVISDYQKQRIKETFQGKTFEEIHGEERAKEIKQKIKKTTSIKTKELWKNDEYRKKVMNSISRKYAVSTKLSEEQIKDIIKKRKSGDIYKKIAKDYNVSINLIKKVCKDINIHEKIYFLPEQINNICKLRKNGDSYNKIANYYNVSYNFIRDICTQNNIKILKHKCTEEQIKNIR